MIWRCADFARHAVGDGFQHFEFQRNGGPTMHPLETRGADNYAVEIARCFDQQPDEV
jgi:hypothetical protein